MDGRPLLIVKTLPNEELSIEVRYPENVLPGPVRMSRCDLLYAMLCDSGVSLKIPGKGIVVGESHV